MAKYTSEDIRNVVFLGEGGNGKTSLVEACLFTSGNTDRQGKIDEENSILDSEPEEHKRRSSILSSVAHADWDSSRFNLIDTPGFSNFIDYVYRKETVDIKKIHNSWAYFDIEDLEAKTVFYVST